MPWDRLWSEKGEGTREPMSHFVVIFDRNHAGSPTIERFDDADEARARLFEAESDLKGDPTKGVVMLFGESEESLRRPHGSLFMDDSSRSPSTVALASTSFK